MRSWGTGKECFLPEHLLGTSVIARLYKGTPKLFFSCNAALNASMLQSAEQAV